MTTSEMTDILEQLVKSEFENTFNIEIDDDTMKKSLNTAVSNYMKEKDLSKEEAEEYVNILIEENELDPLKES